jgi:hypothetical protein
MSFIFTAARASALTLSLAIAGLLALEIAEAEAKTSILYCGAPGNCTPYPYKPHGGIASICATYSPCFLGPSCKGEQVCDSQHPAQAK